MSLDEEAAISCPQKSRRVAWKRRGKACSSKWSQAGVSPSLASQSCPLRDQQRPGSSFAETLLPAPASARTPACPHEDVPPSRPWLSNSRVATVPRATRHLPL